jgi:hypothetical protein
MKINYGDKHIKATGEDCALLGYPDDGNGRYTQTSGYTNWYL